MSHYARPDYWEERYSHDMEPFDIYQHYQHIREYIVENVMLNSRILNIGCGSSRMSEQMFDEGFKNITNIDISQVIINHLQELHKDKWPSMKSIQMNARALEFNAGDFDCVIDKGLLDSVLCGTGSTTNALKVLSEVYRVLAPNGVYIMITYAPSEMRKKYFGLYHPDCVKIHINKLPPNTTEKHINEELKGLDKIEEVKVYQRGTQHCFASVVLANEETANEAIEMLGSTDWEVTVSREDLHLQGKKFEWEVTVTEVEKPVVGKKEEEEEAPKGGAKGGKKAPPKKKAAADPEALPTRLPVEGSHYIYICRKKAAEGEDLEESGAAASSNVNDGESAV